MRTAILRSHDCFQGRFRQEALAFSTYPLRSRRYADPNPNPNSFQARRRKRSPASVQTNQHRYRSRYGDQSVVARSPAANLVMGQVKILKRGEKLSSENTHRVIGISTENQQMRARSEEEDFDLVLGSTDRFGPDPDTVLKQVRVSEFKDGIYAGSAFVTSPPPSSVPVPGFLGRNGAATTDLRRLLRLD